MYNIRTEKTVFESYFLITLESTKEKISRVLVRQYFVGCEETEK